MNPAAPSPAAAPLDRRAFLGRTGAAAVAAAAASSTTLRGAGTAGRPEVHTQQYPWFTFFRREDRDFFGDFGASMAEVAASGVDGFEPILNAADDVDGLLPHLGKHGLGFRSFYVNSTLHDEPEVDDSIATVLAIADRAKAAGAEIVVTNPSPIRWGGAEDKDDAQLRTQAKALDRLGAALRDRGMTLAYHTHAPEMRQGAREFHHMLASTDPAHVKFCFDVHWVFRGCGDSEVAVFDVLRLYGDRIVELHLRQSKGGIWTEAFGPGDIDYRRLARILRESGVRPHLVLEQAVEEGTPETMTAVEAHRRGAEHARKTFA